jgi:hypothetical protein
LKRWEPIHAATKGTGFAFGRHAALTMCERTSSVGRLLAHVAKRQEKTGFVCAAATSKEQLHCSGLPYDQTAYGGMPFGHGAGGCISQGSIMFRSAPRPVGVVASLRKKQAADRPAHTRRNQVRANFVTVLGSFEFESHSKRGKLLDVRSRLPRNLGKSGISLAVVLFPNARGVVHCAPKTPSLAGP